jgi:hypothetical protein
MNKTRLLATAALALTGVLGVGTAQAADVSWTVTIGSHGPVFPTIVRPAPVVVHPVPVVRRVPVAYPVPHDHRYRRPTGWDRDGDGVPNRHDRLYNPVWDRDGDGVPNHRDRHGHRHRVHHH